VPNEPELPEPPMGRLDSRRFEKGRNFTNKIWNAARFVLSSCDDTPLPPAEALEKSLRAEDRWILSRLNRAAARMNEAFDAFDFAKAAQTFYAFFWDEFCAWTIELSKPRLRPENTAEDRAAARAVLLYVLDRSLRLLHPLCPFITEALWDELGKHAPDFAARNLNRAAADAVCAWATVPDSNPSALPEREPVKPLLAESPWPQVEENLFTPELEERYRAIFEAVRAVRNIRQKNGIAPKTLLRVLIRTADENVRKHLDCGRGILTLMAGCAEPEIGPTVEKPKPAGVEALSGAEVYVALEGVVDLDKERTRLDKEIEKKRRYAEAIEKKLANENFAKNAPPHVVDAERDRLKEAKEQIVGLEAARAELA
jgi:valyl-tRNA synthetase